MGGTKPFTFHAGKHNVNILAATKSFSAFSRTQTLASSTLLRTSSSKALAGSLLTRHVADDLNCFHDVPH